MLITGNMFEYIHVGITGIMDIMDMVNIKVSFGYGP